MKMKQLWWKMAAVVLLVYTTIGGLLFEVPRLAIVNETIRALYFHVPMWFAMVVLFLLSTIYSVRYLRNPSFENDCFAVEFANTGMIFGLLGIFTGMIWANYTWGSPWSGDPKQNGAAIALLIYFAYFVLRGSMNDADKRSRISAVYNIFAFAMLFPTIWILPRLTESLHPGGMGSEGNPGLNPNDTSPEME